MKLLLDADILIGALDGSDPRHSSSAVSSFDQKILKAATREGIKAA